MELIIELCIKIMKSATFWVIHPATKSRAMVEFAMINKKIKLIGFYFTQGNVVELKSIRACQQKAKLMFDNSQKMPPFIG